MMTAIPAFNMRRTVADYSVGIYGPAAAQGERLASHDYAGARALAAWKARVREAWPGVSARAVSVPTRSHPRAEPLRMRVAVQLGGLEPGDLRVEFIARRVLPETSREAVPLASYREPLHARDWREPLRVTEEVEPDGSVIYALDAPTVACGQFQGAIRVFPAHELMAHPYELGLMKWMAAG
jgi:starch phosphorylase